MILGPLEVAVIITALTTIAYLLDDGSNIYRSGFIMGIYVLSLILVVPESTTELWLLTSFFFLYVLLRKFLNFVLPKHILKSNNKSAFDKQNQKQILARWETMRKNDLVKIVYTIALFIGLLIAIKHS